MKIFSISLPIFFSLFLLLMIFYIPTITAESPPARCDNTSTFHTNLKILLSSLSFNTSLHNGFYTNTVGQDPYKAYGLALCRGDATPEVCYGCIDTAVGEILSQCPDRSSTKWYDRCMIRYSFINFLGSPRTQTWNVVYNPNNVTNPAQFEKILGNLMNNLSTTAAFEPRTGMFATGEANLSSPSASYGLVQCIRDITPGDCHSCLGDAISQLPKCCVNKEGGRVRGPVCIIWFEVSNYSFYGPSTIEVPAPSPAPAVAGSPRSTNTAPSTNETTRGRDHNLSRIVIILIPAIVISIILLVIVALLRIMKKKTNLQKKKTSTSAMDQLDGSDILLQIDFEMIRVATNDFSDENKLGEGGFGPVYKGSFPDGREIAVKRLSINSRQGVQEFRNEVALVAKLQHRNLVRLYGCCVEGQEKLLIYEYIPNRSLDYFLFDPEKRASLNWKHRFKIIRGIARGLLYLHEDSRLRIIHRDLKPSNILLDADMNPKISDFGLAKIFGTDETHGNTRRIAGTFGYMAPEYVIHGQFSVKLDVFSFGVLLLEIVSGQKNAYESDRGGDILSYIWKAWNDGIVLEVIDSAISAHCSRSEAVRCIQIGLLCVQEDATSRPIMSSIVLMLTSLSFTLPAPSAPTFFISSTMEPALQLASQENRLDPSPSRLPLKAINDVSITELDPR